MQRAGKPYEKYEEACHLLMEGIHKNFVVNNRYIKGNVQDNDPLSQHYFDAASIELFANGLIQDKKLFSTHMKEYNRHLRAVQDDKRGYIRFNSSNSYENQEWPFAGLRVAVAQLKLGNKKEAAELINRITAFASRNNNQIPEILDNETNIYKGAIPMIGYGAGAYIIAVAEQKKKNKNEK
jgi:GH15 family glucan-1,4-alpha-glucosidase